MPNSQFSFQELMKGVAKKRRVYQYVVFVLDERFIDRNEISDGRIKFVLDNEKRITKVTYGKRKLYSVKYKGNTIVRYQDYMGNWYDNTIMKFDCPYTLDDTFRVFISYGIENLKEPEYGYKRGTPWFEITFTPDDTMVLLQEFLRDKYTAFYFNNNEHTLTFKKMSVRGGSNSYNSKSDLSWKRDVTFDVDYYYLIEKKPKGSYIIVN